MRGDFMNNIFDAHAHYDDKWFDEDRDSIIEALPEKGVVGVVSNGIDLKTAKFLQSYADKYPYFYFTAGFHPECLEDVPENYLEEIEKFLKCS